MNEYGSQDGMNGLGVSTNLSLTSFYRSGTLSSSASRFVRSTGSTSYANRVSNHHHDFLSFLAICQRRNIDFVGITWDRVLDDNSNLIGLGLTSEIRPGTMNLDFTFAFKRLTDSNFAQADMASGEQRRHRAYEALISEISVLGHPTIRDHENIMRLEGVCWDFLPDSFEEKVRPVLMFEKARYGDLGRFVRSNQGNSLLWPQKLRLCSNIARGLATMHSCGIIHGDIKPHNVLIFQQTNEKYKDRQNDYDYVAKIADFGYSTCTNIGAHTSGSDDVVLPWSPPWNAPEVNMDNNILSIEDAKLSDIFSFGVTCLWLLFMDKAPESSTENFDQRYRWVSVLKEERKLEVFAKECLDISMHLKSAEKDAMKTFFELTLSTNPHERSKDLQYLLSLLDPGDVKTGSRDVPMIATVDAEFLTQRSLFNISRNLVQFAATDFRLRQYITKCLEMEVISCEDQLCIENAAFQIAFCYKTGFGVQKDESAVLAALEKSRKTADELDVMIQVAFTHYQPYSNIRLGQFISAGYIHNIDFANNYRSLGLLKVSEMYYRREIKDLESAFPNEFVLFRLKTILADILHSQGSYDEEEALLKEMANRLNSDEFRGHYGKGDLDLEGPRTRLAMIYLEKGLCDQAVEIFRDSLASLETKIGRHHPQSLSTSINFASALQQLGKYDAAEAICRECLLHHERNLGSDHPSTLIILGNLAAVLFKQKHTEKALEIAQEVARLDEKWFGPDHHSTLISLNNVATMQGALQKYKNMESTTLSVWQKFMNVLGPEHAHTYTSLSNYGMSLWFQGKDDDAVLVFRQVVDGLTKTRSRNHHDVLITVIALIYTLLGKERTEEAREFMQTFLDGCTPGSIGDIVALKSLGHIGSIFAARGHYDIAEKLLRLAIEREESILGIKAKQTILHMGILTTILLERKKVAEAEVLSRTTLADCQEHRDDVELTFNLYNNLAAALDLQGKHTESVEIYNKSLQTCERVLGPLDRHTLTCYNNLGAALLGQKRYTEAEAFYQKAFDGFKVVSGPENEETLRLASNLARAFRLQGRHKEAVHLLQETLETATKVFGTDHALSRMCEKSLERANQKMATL